MSSPDPRPRRPVSDLEAGRSAVGTAPDAAEVDRIQRRTLQIVVLSQILGGAGLAAGVTVGALLAEQMFGRPGMAGVPTALFTLGSALAAFLVGRHSQARGRRTGLALGFAAGGLGAIGVVLAAVADSIPLLLLSLLVYGSGTSTNLQARYAGTDLAAPHRRGTAVSIAMVATTAGAVAGPNLVDPLGALARTIGVPELAGPFLLAAVAYLGAGAVLWLWLRPDPFLLARRIDTEADAAAAAHAPSDTEVVDRARPPAGPGVVAGTVTMVLTQAAMVAVMTMTPVHMRYHGLTLGAVGIVIGLHIAAMFLPSPLTGILVDRVGRPAMAVAAAAVLLASGLLAAVAGASMTLLTVALILLGLGWNFGLISGTAMVVDGTAPTERPRVQGIVDVFIALSGAAAGALSGVVAAGLGFTGLSLIFGALSLTVLPVLWWARSAAGAGAPQP